MFGHLYVDVTEVCLSNFVSKDVADAPWRCLVITPRSHLSPAARSQKEAPGKELRRGDAANVRRSTLSTSGSVSGAYNSTTRQTNYMEACHRFDRSQRHLKSQSGSMANVGSFVP
jgi:hypothetical protein